MPVFTRFIMTKLFDATNHLLIYSSDIVPEQHKHMAAHIIISLENQIKVETDRDELLCYGVMIPSGIPHKIYTYNSPVLVFLYDNTTAVSATITETKSIDKQICVTVKEYFFEIEQNISKEKYQDFEYRCLQLLEINKRQNFSYDDRITAAVDYIKNNCMDKITRKTVADAVFMSEDRFSHLFTGQIGMTFSAYVIYQRIIAAYTAIINGYTVTDAALYAGFSSSSHFADVSKRVFGLSAKNITKDISFIKIA